MAYTSYLSGSQFPGQQESQGTPAHEDIRVGMPHSYDTQQRMMGDYLNRSSNPQASFKTMNDMINLNLYHSLGQSGHL